MQYQRIYLSQWYISARCQWSNLPMASLRLAFPAMVTSWACSPYCVRGLWYHSQRLNPKMSSPVVTLAANGSHLSSLHWKPVLALYCLSVWVRPSSTGHSLAQSPALHPLVLPFLLVPHVALPQSRHIWFVQSPPSYLPTGSIQYAMEEGSQKETDLLK